MIKTNYFTYKPEDGQNPFCGFMSFQHFRGEPIYSDLIVRPENNMTETEHVECYPVPDYVEEKGSQQGYYPECSSVYIRFLWKEFEPKQGVYNYAFIEDIINKAKAHKQTLAIRLMPHSTRACDDVPEWLKNLIPCPERPDGKRVKDSPTHPLFLELFTEAVRKIGERFDGNPTLESVDICLPGAWGEGHNLHLYSDEALKKLFDAFTDSFRHTRLIAQLARPELIRRAREYCHVGCRGDGFGHPTITYDMYPSQIEQLSDTWKTAPISFEAYWWLGEWMRKGWDIDEMIQLTLQWHISSFNAKSIPIPFEWKDKIDGWIRKMGYHFAIDYFKFPESALPGDEIVFRLGIDNVGVAPIYRKLPLKVKLISDEKEYIFDTDADITKWLPGKYAQALNLTLPQDMLQGEYTVLIGIDYELPVYFCTDAEIENGYYKVGCIHINQNHRLNRWFAQPL